MPGYTYRVWVTSRTESAVEIWRDYNGRATVEQRIEEMKNDLHADGFCTKINSAGMPRPSSDHPKAKELRSGPSVTPL